MKKLLLLLPLLFVSCHLFAQKFGYVDTDYILNQMPEYKEAQTEIDQLAQSWQEEIRQMYKTIQSMHDEYKAQEVLLTDEMKQQKLEEIRAKEEEVKEYNHKVFGAEGLYFLKKKELIKPSMEKVYEAVEKVAKDKKLQIVFDKAGDLIMIYTNPVHDYTDYVLEELGLGDPNDVIK